MSDPKSWLKEHRCPWCKHDGRCKGYKTRKSHEGWQCHGYRSRYDEERRWTA